MHFEKIIPIVLMLSASCICAFVGWYFGGAIDENSAFCVIGFLLPTLIMYWLQKINNIETQDKESKD